MIRTSTFIFLLFYCLTSSAQHDAKVEAIYTLAKIPAPLGVYKHVVQARIHNTGTDMLTNLPVTLTVTGMNTYTDTKLTDIAPGNTALISFTQYSPWNPGNNSVTVTVPPDDNNSNNSAAYSQEVNPDTYSYADDAAPLSSLGYGNSDGILLTKYRVSGSALVKKVKVHISSDGSNTGNTVYGVVVNFGTIIGQSAPHVITAGELGSYITLDIIDPPAVDYDFYVGLLQTENASTAYYPVSYQDEGVPTRPEAYYGSFADGSGITSLDFFGRLMIQAVVDIGTVAPFNATINSPFKLIAGWDFSGTNSPGIFAATTFDTLLSSTNSITRGPGVPASNGIHSFRSTGFQNGGIAVTNTGYYEVQLSPKPGDTLSLSTITGYLHGNSNDITNNPVISQFAYSTNGTNFTLIGTPFETNTTVQNFTVSLGSISALQNIVEGTTVTLRYYASGATAAAGWGFVSLEPGYNGLAVYGKLVTANTILTSPVVPTGAVYTLNDCASTATGSISFTSTGTFGSANKYVLQLGQVYEPHFNIFRFRFPVTIGELQTNANSGIINFTIPAGTTDFDPYALRIISTQPYTEGTLSQPFTINNIAYCHSQPTDKFRSRVTGNWNDVNSWESFNGTEWIPATLIPDENATGIEIRREDSIDITTNIVVTNSIVRGTLRLLNGNGNNGMISFINPMNPNPASIALKVDTSGVFQVIAGEAPYNDAIFYVGGNVRIYGKVIIGDGTIATTEGFDAFATDESGTILWYAGSVFEWNSTSGSGPVSNKYFPDGNEASTLRLTNIPGGVLGNNQPTVINGLLEINTPVTWTGTGTKTFRDGIKGTSTITQAAGSGQFIVNSFYQEIPQTSTTLAAFRGILDGSLAINLSENGLLLEGGARLPDSAKISLTGECVALQKLELMSGAKLTLNPGSVTEMQDADLVNAGLINGTGQVKFTGAQLSSFSSTGLTEAPVLISNKQLALGANSNTGDIALANESNLKLDIYHLNMIGAATLIADSVNFIVTNDTGRLNRYVAGPDVLFPIGVSNSSYTALTISNAGTEDYIKAGVSQGVQAAIPVTSENADRTWHIGDTAQTGLNLTLQMRWKASDEQADFDRNGCYISHYTSCPPPLNCTTGYFDATIPGMAFAGTDFFTIQRTGITNFKSTSFIVTSRPFVYSFTGSGDWNDAANWTPAIVAPAVIPTGIEVIIDGSGECIHNGDIIVQTGGRLTLQPGKQLKVMGNLDIQ